MKKIASMLIVLALVFSCTAALAELTFGTGGPAGVYYAYGNVLAQYITNNTDLDITAISTGGSSDNIDSIDLGDMEIAFTQNDVANYAYNGIRFERYDGKAITTFRALAALYTESVQLVTCNPEIKSVEDLKGKNVSIGAAGSGVYFNAMDFFAAYDMTEADINPQYLSFGDSAEALKDGKIDAAFIVAGYPAPAVSDLSASKQAYLVSLDDEHVAKLQEISSAYVKSVIPAETYKGIDEDTVTVGIKATVIASENMSEDDAYTIVSTIFENKADIAEVHAKGAELDLEYAATCGLPYHPGAAKYFAEKGFEVETAD